jgi:hypothetical protein
MLTKGDNLKNFLICKNDEEDPPHLYFSSAKNGPLSGKLFFRAVAVVVLYGLGVMGNVLPQ